MHKNIYDVFLEFYGKYQSFYNNEIQRSSHGEITIEPVLKEQIPIFFNNIDSYKVLENSTKDDFDRIFKFYTDPTFRLWQYFIYSFIFNDYISIDFEHTNVRYIVKKDVKPINIVKMFQICNKISRNKHNELFNIYVLNKDHIFSYALDMIINKTIFDDSVEPKLITKNIYPIYELLKDKKMTALNQETRLIETLFVLYEIDPGYFNTDISIDQFKNIFYTFMSLNFSLNDFLERIKNYNEIKMLEIQEMNIL